MRILIADDNRDAADSLGVLLSLSGHDVRVVFDGRAAVQASVQWAPDVAVLDFRQGLEALVKPENAAPLG